MDQKEHKANPAAAVEAPIALEVGVAGGLHLVSGSPRDISP